MKKRINSSEIEKAKRSNRFLFILTELMLLVVIGGLVFYVLYDKKLIKFDNIKNTTEEDIISKNETKFNVNTNNKEVLKLYNTVRISNNDCSEYIDSKSLKTDKLSEECKFDIASNIYNKYLVEENGNKFIPENEVIYAYESLYGEESYKNQELIPYKNESKLYYSAINEKYILQNDVQDSDTNMSNHEDIISIKKDNSYLYINTAVLYYESINKFICKDYKCDEIVEKLNDEANDEYFKLYIKHNKNKLYNYQYKFKLDKNGFYKYIGFERTNK